MQSHKKTYEKTWEYNGIHLKLKFTSILIMKCSDVIKAVLTQVRRAGPSLLTAAISIWCEPLTHSSAHLIYIVVVTITINKSQGQRQLCIFLPEPVFSHGQLSGFLKSKNIAQRAGSYIFHQWTIRVTFKDVLSKKAFRIMHRVIQRYYNIYF